jgi:hypothetical protein
MIQIRKSTYLVALFLLGLCAFSFAQNTTSQNGDNLTLKIAVMGPGDQLYFWWGHIALIIEDSETVRGARFYDWGVFSFDANHFFTNFALGRLIYMCMVSRASVNFDYYIENNRDITVYTLDLDAKTKAEVQRFVDNNVRPENRDYLYHHFRDNCATRIRDIIDDATGGQFKARFGDAPGRYTLRQHVRRHTWFSPFFDWFLSFLMGQNIDEQITVWDEMFLPSEIGSQIQNFSYVDASGRERQLVTDVTVLNEAVNRPQVLAIPRKQWPRELALGLAIAALLAILQHAPLSSTRRVWLGISHSILGFFFGICGLLLYFMTFFSNHDYTYNNINIAFISPLLFAAIPLGIQLARGKHAGRRFPPVSSAEPRRGEGSPPEQLLCILWTIVFFGGIFTMLIKLSPAFYQQNQVTQALVLPFAFVLSYVPKCLHKIWVTIFRLLRRRRNDHRPLKTR